MGESHAVLPRDRSASTRAASPSSPTWRAHLVQATPAVGDLKANVARVLDELGRTDAELVVFPELFLSGYVMRDDMARCAFGLDDEPARTLIDACRRTGKHLVVGFPRRTGQRGVLANSLLFTGPDGLIGHYDKVYLPTFSVFEEDHWFREGEDLPVWDTALGRIGLSICYDFFFPEVPKALALQGADVIICASASPTQSRRYFEAVFPARAIETTAYILYANLAGPQDAVNFWGAAQGWSPLGNMIGRGPYDVEGAIDVDVDMGVIEEARRKRPALRDTRRSVLETLARTMRDRD